jgi:chromosome segregation ATPase
MTQTRLGLVFVFLAPLALWGCAQEPKSRDASLAAEWNTKVTRLQEEVRGLASCREQLAIELKEAQQQKDQLLQELQLAQAEVHSLTAARDRLRQQLCQLEQERDTLRQKLDTRTEERDNAVAQVDLIHNGVRALLQQVETAANTLPRPLAAAAPVVDAQTTSVAPVP